MKAKKQFPIAEALRQVFKGGYSFSLLRSDLISGFVVSLVALPLSMALAIAVGLSPEHGIYTAIVAGVVAALLGGSPNQVSGPTAAFVVIIAPIVAELGLRGIVWCQIIAGVILIIFGIMRFGRLINFVPYPVTTGFTAGIAVVIATISLNDFFGLGITKYGESYIDKVMQIFGRLHEVNHVESLIGFATLLILILGNKVIKRVPTPVTAILFASVAGYYALRYGFEVSTIETKFSYMTERGGFKGGIPPYAPKFLGGDLFSFPDLAEFKTLILPAFAIAALAALESLLSATVADSIAGTKHYPNSELTGVGFANIASGLVAGIPATGAIARTTTAINSGAKTPFASVMHSVFILLYVLFFAEYINHIPMTALSALLLVTAYRMSHIKQFIRVTKIAPPTDIMVLFTCFFLTVFVDMVAGVMVGMVLSSFLLIKQLSDATHIDLQKSQAGSKKNSHMATFKINGPLFFGNIEQAVERMPLDEKIDTFLFDLSQVPFIDMSGLVALKSLVAMLKKKKIKIIFKSNDRIAKLVRRKLKANRLTKNVVFEGL